MAILRKDRGDKVSKPAQFSCRLKFAEDIRQLPLMLGISKFHGFHRTQLILFGSAYR